jgi:hypothetical protein
MTWIADRQSHRETIGKGGRDRQSGSHRTRFGTASSPQRSTPVSHSATYKKPRRMRTRERRCATTEAAAPSTATPPTSSQPSSPAPAADGQGRYRAPRNARGCRIWVRYQVPAARSCDRFSRQRVKSRPAARWFGRSRRSTQMARRTGRIAMTDRRPSPYVPVASWVSGSLARSAVDNGRSWPSHVWSASSAGGVFESDGPSGRSSRSDRRSLMASSISSTRSVQPTSAVRPPPLSISAAAKSDHRCRSTNS